jgi:hypothetical protein
MGSVKMERVHRAHPGDYGNYRLPPLATANRLDLNIRALTGLFSLNSWCIRVSIV